MQPKLLARRNRLTAVVPIVAIGLLIAGCSTQVSKSDSVVDPPKTAALAACSADIMRDTKAAITDMTKTRIAAEGATVGWSNTKLVDDSTAMSAITRAAMLPCEPTINTSSPASNPENIQAIMSAMPLDLWSKLVISSHVGKAPMNGPAPSGFSKPEDSYKTFLTVAARLPFFCGDKGVWESNTAACKRELTTVFSHTIQETGEQPPPAGEESWQTSLSYTREMGCYDNPSGGNCANYQAGATEIGAPKESVFYGRGMKQLSWAYNYSAFSGAYFGDRDILLKDPDLVASRADLILGSGIWFYMSPQPPKPSIHDVMTGIYQPKASSSGITKEKDNGSVFEKFSTTISVMNGAFECALPPGPSAEGPMQASKNRFTNFKTLLPRFGVNPANETQNEKEMKPGVTYCAIEKGNPFVNENLIYNPAWYYNPDKNTDCRTVGYAGTPPLPAASDGSWKLCQQLMAGPVPDPVPTTPKPEPSATTQTASGSGMTVTMNESVYWGGYCINSKLKNGTSAVIKNWYYEFTVPSTTKWNQKAVYATAVKATVVGGNTVYRVTGTDPKDGGASRVNIGANATIDVTGMCFDGPDQEAPTPVSLKVGAA